MKLDKTTRKARAARAFVLGHKSRLTIAEAEAAVIAKRNELFTHNDMDRRAA